MDKGAMERTTCKNTWVFLWIVALAFLSVGARNFEEGLSIDGPLYAALARNLSRSTDWGLMQVDLPEYSVYADHTHFGFWLHALWLKIFPAKDWALRIPSHFMYVLFLFGFWKVVSHLNSVRVATIAVLLLWIWAPFSNYFSNFYLDPGALLLGSLFLVFLWKGFKSCWWWAVLSGIFLGLCAGYKGLTFLAFGPVAAMFSIAALSEGIREKRASSVVLKTFLPLFSFFVVVGLYYLLIRHSSVPDFFERYWSKQMTYRFAGSWGMMELFKWNFWIEFFKGTLWLGILIFPALWRCKSYSWGFLVPFLMFVTVVAMYAPTDRSGGQYWIMLFPWAAWLIAQFLDATLFRMRAISKLSSNKMMKFTGGFSLVAVLLIQYLPFRTHARQAPEEVKIISELPHFRELESIYFDLNQQNPDFASASPLLWYLDKKIEYVVAGSLPPSSLSSSPHVYILRHSTPEKINLLRQAGWCEYRLSVYLPCTDNN